MATIIDREELLRKALKFVIDRRKDDPSIDIYALLDEAGARFNLSPLDQESLQRLLSSLQGGAQA